MNYFIIKLKRSSKSRIIGIIEAAAEPTYNIYYQEYIIVKILEDTGSIKIFQTVYL